VAGNLAKLNFSVNDRQRARLGAWGMDNGVYYLRIYIFSSLLAWGRSPHTHSTANAEAILFSQDITYGTCRKEAVPRFSRTNDMRKDYSYLALSVRGGILVAGFGCFLRYFLSKTWMGKGRIDDGMKSMLCTWFLHFFACSLYSRTTTLAVTAIIDD
jgi:hypothetical protein